MADQTVESYSNQLKELGIYNEIVEHPSHKAISDVLNSISPNLTLSDSIPTLIMKADDKFIAVVIRGDTKADFKKIKKDFKIKDLRMATPDEFKDITGVPLGAACVYTPKVSQTIIDKKVMEKEFLYGGSGSFTATIKYRTADLVKIPGVVVGDIC